MAAAASISVDEFQALEQKVLQTVELIKKERELRATAETRTHEVEGKLQTLEAAMAELAAQRQQLEAERTQLQQEREVMVADLADLREKHVAGQAVAAELDAMKRERESVRQRVESMLAQMDELL